MWVIFFAYIITIKTIYHYDEVFVSAQKKETGELSILLNEFELSSKYLQWMEIYAYYQDHLDYSQLKLANHLNTSQATVQRAIAFMSAPLHNNDSDF